MAFKWFDKPGGTVGNIIRTYMITCGNCVGPVHYPDENAGFGIPTSEREAESMARKAGWAQATLASNPASRGRVWICPRCVASLSKRRRNG